MPSSSALKVNSTKLHSTNKTPINDILQNMLKTSNTNNSTQDNFNHKQSSNNHLTTVSNKSHGNNITFDNFNYKHTPILQYKIF